MSKKIPVINKLTAILRWLYPGVGIKRWTFLALLGILLIVLGASHSFRLFKHISAFDLVFLVFGLGLVFVGVWKIISLLIEAFLPKKEKHKVAAILYQKNLLSKGPKIVVIGGGSGQSVLLKGFKEYTSNITAIVTVADSGGSSGRLRDSFDILPPGDIRNCLVALAEAEPLVRDLFQYRFGPESSELEGHSFGNLFITALTKVAGDFEAAVKASSQVLAIRGEVVPSTYEKVSLVAEYEDGSIVKGEAEIPKQGKRIKRVMLEPNKPVASIEALHAIEQADIIFLGPGSLYTSIVPNLLVKDISEKLKASSAAKVYVCNVMTQKGETDGFSVYDHLKVLIDHAGHGIISHCVVDNTFLPKSLRLKYQKEGSAPVTMSDVSEVAKLGVDLIYGNVVDTQGLLRHNPHKIYSLVKGSLF